MPVSVHVEFDHFADLAKQLREEALKEVESAAQHVRDAASANAAERTGALKASYYVATNENNGYNDAASAATALNPKAELADAVEQPPEGTAVISSAVGYAPDQEYGTTNSPAHPALIPAMEAYAAAFFDALTRVLE